MNPKRQITRQDVINLAQGILENARQDVINLAQGILENDRHWTVVHVGDRAQDGADLAELILDFLKESPNECLPDCPKCQEQKENIREVEFHD